MEEGKFNKNKVINHWVESSDANFNSMLVIYETKQYNWALFIGHLCVEKLLKALYVKVNNNYPPLIHDLIVLVNKCNLEITEEEKLCLGAITKFNINGRYEDYKKDFYKLCTPAYTAEWIEKIKLTRKWIKKLIEK